MSMTMNEDTDYDNSNGLYYFIWILAGISLIFGPCLCFKKSRMICFRRIKLCRWNVPTDDLRDTSFLRETFQPRYPIDDPRHVVTEAASNESKKNFITGQLKNYTKTIEESDFTHVPADKYEHVKEEMKLSKKRTSLLHNKHGSSKDTKPDSSSFTGLLMSALGVSGVNGAPASDDTVDDHIIMKKHESCHDVENDDIDNSTDSKVSLKLPVLMPSESTVTDITESSHTQKESMIKVLLLPHPSFQVDPEQEGPNQTDDDIESQNVREVFPECSICLAECVQSEKVSWSPNKACHHCFHHDCLETWFMTLARRADARRGKRSYDIECELNCPICRQTFISTSFDDTEEEVIDVSSD